MDYQKKEGITMQEVPLNQKYTLTIKEASQYFNIGIKKLRRLSEPLDEEGTLPDYALRCGGKFLIIRHLFEKHLMEEGEV